MYKPRQENGERLLEKLDRVLYNMEWCIHFNETSAKILPRLSSYHHTLKLRLRGSPYTRNNHPFQFEAMWMAHESFFEFLNGNQNNQNETSTLLTYLTTKLKMCNYEIFGHLKKKKKKKKERKKERKKFLPGLVKSKGVLKKLTTHS